METQAHLPILKRLGRILITLGTIDVGVMIYCIANGESYSSSFNIFAILAGVFLIRGNLQAASIVRMFAAFYLAAFLSMAAILPILQPIDLTLTQLRLNPGDSAFGWLPVFLVSGILVFLIRGLGQDALRTALLAAGIKRRDLRVAALIGVALVASLGMGSVSMQGSSPSKQAISIAKQQLGPGYKYYVTSIHSATNNHGTLVSGEVTAWNSKEIRTIPVKWEED